MSKYLKKKTFFLFKFLLKTIYHWNQAWYNKNCILGFIKKIEVKRITAKAKIRWKKNGNIML